VSTSVLSDAEVAVLAAQAGASIARAHFGAETRYYDHAGVDFSTDADIEAERAIRGVLSEHRPQDAIVGEELGRSGDSSRRWLVDPICGTLNFAAGLPLFAVNVALDIEGTSAAAAVADPMAARVLWTDGERARHRPDAPTATPGADLPLAPSASSRLISLDLDSHHPDPVGARVLFDQALRARFSPRCLSTTLALAWVASGQQAAYITDRDLRESVHWTAGIALCRTAGAVVTNLAGGELHTGAHGMVAAADAATHAFVIGTLSAGRL
jgi:myo-inositol-1(or 4)-monophosphatase